MNRDEAIRLLREHQDDLRRLKVEAVYLFGSVARQEAGPTSDVDVLIDVVRPFTYLDLVEVQSYLEGLFGCSVDVGTRAMLRADLQSEVWREAVRAA